MNEGCRLRRGGSRRGAELMRRGLVRYTERGEVRTMYSVRVEAEFSAAHRIVHYHGKCERFHGHNYRVRVWASGEVLGEGGMLVDFGVLKGALRSLIDERLDHRDLNEIQAFENDPSAERIAEYIYRSLHESLPEILISAVDVFETATSMARFTPSAAR